jgi:putative SOS response-associated peptidase YedK
MCGRFTQTQSGVAIAQAFQLAAVPTLVPRYNIAPSQPVGVIVQTQENLQSQWHLLQWGLVPFWAKDPSLGARMINARAETIAEKPAFRAAFRYRRGLVPADGFYEWQVQTSKRKQPFYMQLGDRQPFAFASLWESWQAADGSVLETCTIITTAANELMQPIHDRMPVILHLNDYAQWLDPTQTATAKLQPLLKPYPSNQMVAYPVSTVVNRATYDDPACIVPL